MLLPSLLRKFGVYRTGYVSLSFGGAMMAATANAMVPPSERAVLDAIYDGTGGSTSWTDSTGWDLPPSQGMSECNNFGVTCVQDAQGHEHISVIDLHQNGLMGELPPSLSSLPYLETFDVWGNQIGGSIPALDGLSKLTMLSLSYHPFGGSIPSLANTPKLRYFYANWNQLSGAIPSLSALTDLLGLDISDNHLTGSIPALDGLLKLAAIDVSGKSPFGSHTSAFESDEPDHFRCL